MESELLNVTAFLKNGALLRGKNRRNILLVEIILK